MKVYEVELKFIDGTKVIIEVEADDGHDAMNKAMPISLELR